MISMRRLIQGPVTLRQFLWLCVAGAGIHVAVITVILGAGVAPAAWSIRRHAERVLGVHDAAGEALAGLAQSVAQVRRLVDSAAADPVRITAAARPIRARLDSISAVGASALLSGVPAQLRVALASAAAEESAVHLALLNALAALELRRTEEAAASLARAAAARNRTEALIRAAQRMALADVVARQRRLGELATLATRTVLIWLLAGLAMLPFLMVFVRRRLYQPLHELEIAAARVSAGDLTTTVPARDDELGRLGRLFNSMTAMLRQRTEEEHRHSEARYRAAFQHAALGMAEIGVDGRFRRVNEAYCRFLGYSEEQLLGMHERDVVHPDDRPDDEARYRAAESGEVPLYHREKHFVDAHGRSRWGNMTASLVQGADGSGGYWLGVIEDTTERRHLEAQLAQAHKLESIGRLAGGIAHDFNNILTGVIAHQEFVLGALTPDHPAYEDTLEIGRAANRAADVTRQLLAFARRQVVEPKVLNLNDIVGSIDKLLRRLLGADIRLETILAGDLAHARVDPTQFEQVVINLAVNARDAMPHGGSLVLRTANVVLDEEYASRHPGVAPGPYVGLAVMDDGVGMDAATIRMIFEPFFTTKDRSRGTGLGLAVTYGIVKQAGGHIDVTSAPGTGTTFHVYLPRAHAPAEAPAASVAAPAMGTGQERILLVEDDAVVREALRRGLQEHGYHVITADDGNEAMRQAMAHEGEIDLLVTDLILPYANGREVAATLLARQPSLKVLYISGYTDEQADVLAPEVAAALLRKPFSTATLVARIRRLFDTPASRTDMGAHQHVR